METTHLAATYPTAERSTSTTVSADGLYSKAASILGTSIKADSASIAKILTNVNVTKARKNGSTLPFHLFLITINITIKTDKASIPPARIIPGVSGARVTL